ncbi:tetratricopeptide repeat protein [Amycolatopsis thailandensis]|uniref:tetratricopeptide repeat protein n=1 Tax=Amycolatopsis thailandensis TaxID=589330 RepID=UPI0037AF745A
MPIDVVTYRVFIASPGGLEAERNAVREEVEKFNKTYATDSGFAFSAAGWEDVPGGSGRPQKLINDLVECCDYMILILGHRWGSSSSIDGQYSSGTEEEFYVAKDCIHRTEAPMEDILVLFKGVPEAQLSDPGLQLQKVLTFKEKLEESKELLYKTFDDLDGLRQEVDVRLRGWMRHALNLGKNATTRPVSNSLPDPTVDPTIEAAPDGSALTAAEAFEAKGLMTQAEAAYAKAIVDSDVTSLERYARFLRRTGRFAKSLEINQQVLTQLASSPDSNDTVVERARIMVSIGIVHRKLGDLRESRYSLNEAVQTARTGGSDALDVLAYALDNLGITASRSGDNSQAVECYQEALSARKKSGDEAGQARTLTNLARWYKKSGNTELARSMCSEAIALLGTLDDKPALASAHATMGEILEIDSDLGGAMQSYAIALQLNEESGVPDSIAMSLNQVARISFERGDLAAAERYAQRALNENERTSNREGVVSSNHLLGRIFGRTGRVNLAIGLLDEAAIACATMGNPNGEAWARFHLFEVQRSAGNKTEASQSLERARSLVSITGNENLRLLINRNIEESS